MIPGLEPTIYDTMPILAWSVHAAFILVMLGVVLAFLRLVLGPTLPDRVVALDTMTVLIVTFCGLYVFQSGSTAFLDVAVVLALVGFLATVALARFVERRADRAPWDPLPQHKAERDERKAAAARPEVADAELVAPPRQGDAP
jgi:multicomponent Na+:H+ antiporter subunit F